MNLDELAHGMDWRGEDLSGWYLSEKFDGCRAWWDGSKMWTRQGNVIALPDWFSRELPAAVLDGEMWCGRGGFGRASVAVRLGRIDRTCRFVAFDAPGSAGDWLARMAVVKRALEGCAVAGPADIFPCHSSRHALGIMRCIKSAGGEGIMARRPGAPYAGGRSRDLLKLKREPVPASPASPAASFAFALM